MRLLLAFLLVLIAACERGGQSEPSSDATASVSPGSPDGMQAINEQRLAREALPGKVHYVKHCQACHDGTVKKAPHRDMIGLMTPEAILGTITSGIMQVQASPLSHAERVELAEYLAGDELGGELARLPACSAPLTYQAGQPGSGHSWGIEVSNQRSIPASSGGIDSGNVARLSPAWAVAFPGANRVRSQPTFAGGLLFVGSHSGKVYALDDETGCEVWSFQASGEVRTGIVIDESADNPMVFFGDVLANVYGLDAITGEQVWKIRADEHPNATITGTPTPYGGALYIPVSSLEVSLAVDPNYECCTFRGSVVAVTAATGEQRWKTYTIRETPGVTGRNPVGTNIIGPSGAVVWNSPSIDPVTGQLFIGTGENLSSPASLTSDAMIAMDLDTGAINWVFQATPNDAWNSACDTDTPENCPVENGPDFDFGGATLVLDTSKRGRLVIAGQKSGLVHAVDPVTGKLVWQTHVGRGGIQGGIHFGIAAKDDTLLVPISDMADGRTYPDADRPGMHALDANTGEPLWSTLHDDRCGARQYCHPGISQVPTVIGDLVFAGAMDGVARAYSIETGEIVWSLDTTETSYDSLTGEQAFGGSLGGAAGPIAFRGMLLLSSGYGIYNHMPGNLLLALRIGPDPQPQTPEI